MPNDMFKFAHQIRLAAKELETDDIKEEPILIDEKVKTRISKELQAYNVFLRKFMSVKGNEKVLGKIKPLLDNPRLRKPRNSILTMLENNNQLQPIGDISDLITDLRRVLMRYGSKVEKYPAIKLLKEILNYGVVNGVSAFKRLLSAKRRLYNTFGAEGSLEREQQTDNKK
jgi:hypothetical protein